ncbi:hypothetical protein DFH06DRAFT_1121978 [Mycena polygramma]|nr:hypothetical protein DFH06DRAFT_1121978 [Mycena polygramma]
MSWNRAQGTDSLNTPPQRSFRGPPWKVELPREEGHKECGVDDESSRREPKKMEVMGKRKESESGETESFDDPGRRWSENFLGRDCDEIRVLSPNSLTMRADHSPKQDESNRQLAAANLTNRASKSCNKPNERVAFTEVHTQFKATDVLAGQCDVQQVVVVKRGIYSFGLSPVYILFCNIPLSSTMVVNIPEMPEAEHRGVDRGVKERIAKIDETNLAGIIREFSRPRCVDSSPPGPKKIGLGPEDGVNSAIGHVRPGEETIGNFPNDERAERSGMSSVTDGAGEGEGNELYRWVPSMSQDGGTGPENIPGARSVSANVDGKAKGKLEGKEMEEGVASQNDTQSAAESKICAEGIKVENGALRMTGEFPNREKRL